MHTRGLLYLLSRSLVFVETCLAAEKLVVGKVGVLRLCSGARGSLLFCRGEEQQPGFPEKEKKARSATLRVENRREGTQTKRPLLYKAIKSCNSCSPLFPAGLFRRAAVQKPNSRFSRCGVLPPCACLRDQLTSKSVRLSSSPAQWRSKEMKVRQTGGWLSYIQQYR